MKLSRFLLRLFGWSVDITIPDVPKAIICVAPHTSNWDFVLGKLAYASVGRKSGFLMKSSWFFFPLGLIFKSMGGIPVNRTNKKTSLVDEVIRQFDSHEKLTIAITPEGTRKATKKWHTGFLRIAEGAKVPIFLGVIDYPNKKIMINEEFRPSGDIEQDMSRVKQFYSSFHGKYADKFTV